MAEKIVRTMSKFPVKKWVNALVQPRKRKINPGQVIDITPAGYYIRWANGSEGSGWFDRDLEAGPARNTQGLLVVALVAAITESGYRVSGPTDHRVAEHGEPKWVCNARAVIAYASARPKETVVIEVEGGIVSGVHSSLGIDRLEVVVSDYDVEREDLDPENDDDRKELIERQEAHKDAMQRCPHTHR